MPSYPESPDRWKTMAVERSYRELSVGGWQVMQVWERPLMAVMVQEIIGDGKRDILEVGFGMGMAAELIARSGCGNYTVIEAHPEIAENARIWACNQPMPTKVIEALWQECVGEINGESFDGIIFDTYPLTREERHRNHYSFIPVAAKLLRSNGLFTYYSDETVKFRQDHLMLLLKNFKNVKLLRIDGLIPFDDCEYWDCDHMVIPVARKE